MNSLESQFFGGKFTELAPTTGRILARTHGAILSHKLCNRKFCDPICDGEHRLVLVLSLSLSLMPEATGEPSRESHLLVSVGSFEKVSSCMDWQSFWEILCCNDMCEEGGSKSHGKRRVDNSSPKLTSSSELSSRLSDR